MARPVVFVHGLWLHASSWQPWLDLFAQHGYDPVAPGWPHEPPTVEEARLQPEAVAGLGIEEVADHYADIIAGLPERPVLVGHSFGGLLAQKLLGRNLAVAAVAINASQIRGVLVPPLSQLRATAPVLGNPANIKKAVRLTAGQFRYGFANAVSRDESDVLYDRWTIPSPARPLFQAAAANVVSHSPAAVDTRNARRGPLLLVAGGRDHLVPVGVTRSTQRQYRHSTAVTDLLPFADRGHSLVVDSGWREVAQACLTWLDRALTDQDG